MSVLCYQLVDSGSGSITNENESGEIRDVALRFLLGRVSGFVSASNEAQRFAPRYIDDNEGRYWVRRRLRLNGIGNSYWDTTAEYQTLTAATAGGEEGGGDGNQPQPGSIAWDTTGRSERIFQALEETAYPEGAPSFDRALNANGTGVDGLDVVRPGMRYSETWVLPASLAMGEAYMRSVYTLTGSVNAEKFRCFDPGEALFMGARCQWQGDQPFAMVTFDWEARPNVADYYVSEGFGETFFKEGWEYVWVRYSDVIDSDTLVRRAKYAYKCRVFPKLSWSGIAIANEEKPGRPVDPQLPPGWNQPVGQVQFGGVWGVGL
jgi:hypothetical protein